MQDRDPMSDEIPLADAVEQAQETAAEPLDQVNLPDEAPMEVPTPDWREQCRDVVGADDRDEYGQ